MAAFNGNIEGVQFLLSNGADIEIIAPSEFVSISQSAISWKCGDCFASCTTVPSTACLWGTNCTKYELIPTIAVHKDRVLDDQSSCGTYV